MNVEIHLRIEHALSRNDADGINAKAQRRKDARAEREFGFQTNADRLVLRIDSGKFLFASSRLCVELLSAMEVSN